MRCSFFDHGDDLLWPGDVNGVARPRNFHHVTFGSRGVPPFKIGINGSILCGYQHPARFVSPRRRRDNCVEIVGQVEHLRSCHESGLLSRQVGCEVLMKLRRIEVSESVCRLLYSRRLTKVAGETLSVISLILSNIWHMSRDVDQTGNGWIVPGFSNYHSPVAVSNKNARSILLSKDALCGGHIFFKGRLRLLDDADVVAILDENLIHAFPAGTICPGTVNQNNIPNALLFALC